MIKFVHGEPALIVEKKILVIGDLHLGIAYELYKNGIIIPDQLPEMQSRIQKLIKRMKAERLVILGDIKHEVPGIGYREMVNIPRFLEEISQMVKIDITIGNHDTYLSKIAPKSVKIHPSSGFRIGKYFFMHGHTWPSKVFASCDYIIIGHAHPIFDFRDKTGYKTTKPVWIIGKIRKEKVEEKYKVQKTGKLKMIITPSFNQFLGGSAINSRKKSEEFLGPLFKNDFVDIGRCQIYLLDGTYIGKLGDIKLER